MWEFACPDWFDRLKAGQSLIPDLPLDKAAASRAVQIFNKLRIPDIVDQPEMAEAAGDWIRGIVAAVFGSLDDENVRRVPELFCLVPKKNSKTTNGAGIMMTAMIVNEVPRGEFLLVGPTQEIADLAFQQASGMIEADPILSKRFQVIEHKKTIKDRWNKATLKIKTFDMKVMTGAKPLGVLIDELHIMSSMSYASRVIGQIRGAFAAKPEGFLIFITTQSDQPPSGCFKAELQLARSIRDGRVVGEAATMLPVLYEFPEDMQTDKARLWANPDCWHMVLPNLGLSINLAKLKSLFAAAKEKGEEEIRRFASQHLNIEIGLGLHSERWRGADYWEQCADEGITLEALLDRCEVAVVGIDGGGLDDLFGLAVVGRCKATDDWLYWTKAWAQRDILTLRPENAEKLEDLARDGDLVFCEDATQDIEEIVEIVVRVNETGLFPEKNGIGLDPQGVGALVDSLEQAGIESDKITGVAQGFRLSSAVWTMERKLKDGAIRHSGSAMMNWCVGNAKTQPAGNGVMITKQVSGKSKIDPLCACLNATKLMEWNPVAADKSVYEDRGMIVV